MGLGRQAFARLVDWATGGGRGSGAESEKQCHTGTQCQRVGICHYMYRPANLFKLNRERLELCNIHVYTNYTVFDRLVL